MDLTTSRVSDLASGLSSRLWRGVWNLKKALPWVDTQALLIGDARPLWIDWSENQGFVDVSILAANGVQGIVGRAGRTWMSVYPDPLFAGVYNAAPHYGLYRTSYHVIHTDKDIVAQTNLWYSAHPERDVIPRWIDLEVDRGDSTAQKAARTWQMVELVEARDGVPPTIYSRTQLVNAWLVPHWTPEKLNHVTWALAQYLFDRTREHPGPPALPTGVRADRVLYHQTADKIPGWPGSIGSSALDRDRWLVGDVIEMQTYIVNNWSNGMEERIAALEQLVADLQSANAAQDKRLDHHGKLITEHHNALPVLGGRLAKIEAIKSVVGDLLAKLLA